MKMMIDRIQNFRYPILLLAEWSIIARFCKFKKKEERAQSASFLLFLRLSWSLLINIYANAAYPFEPATFNKEIKGQKSFGQRKNSDGQSLTHDRQKKTEFIGQGAYEGAILTVKSYSRKK